MKHRILTRIALCLAFLIVPISASKGGAIVNPKFALVKAVTMATISDEIAPGTPRYSLDLRLDTAGLAVSGLQFYFMVTPVITPGSLLTFDTVQYQPASRRDLCVHTHRAGTHEREWHGDDLRSTRLLHAQSAGAGGCRADRSRRRVPANLPCQTHRTIRHQ